VANEDQLPRECISVKFPYILEVLVRHAVDSDLLRHSDAVADPPLGIQGALDCGCNDNHVHDISVSCTGGIWCKCSGPTAHGTRKQLLHVIIITILPMRWHCQPSVGYGCGEEMIMPSASAFRRMGEGLVSAFCFDARGSFRAGSGAGTGLREDLEDRERLSDPEPLSSTVFSISTP
jgi:hypothetical protein